MGRVSAFAMLLLGIAAPARARGAERDAAHAIDGGVSRARQVHRDAAPAIDGGAPRERQVQRDAAPAIDGGATRERQVQRDAAHASGATPGGQQGPRKSKKPAVAGVLNVNRATEAELKLLPGIGRGRAHAIVERRNKRPFSSLDELARMKGMKGVVHRLRAHLTVDGETTLRPAGA